MADNVTSITQALRGSDAAPPSRAASPSGAPSSEDDEARAEAFADLRAALDEGDEKKFTRALRDLKDLTDD